MKKLLFVALSLVFLFACKNPQNDGGTPSNKTDEFKVNFSVKDGEGGTLTAKIKDGNAITTGGKVVKDKEVVFTATPKDSTYSVESWTLNGNPIEEAKLKNEKKEFTLAITGEVTVIVKFKKEGGTPQPNPNEFKVNFSVKDGEGGTLTAKIKDGDAITTGDKVAKDKEVVFTATPKDSTWSVESWTLNGSPVEEAKLKNEKKEFTLAIKEEVTVIVKFKKEGSNPPSGDPDLNLISLKVHGSDVDMTNWKIDIPNNKDSVKQGNVEAVFNYGSQQNQPIPVTVTNGDGLAVGVEKDVTLAVSAVQGQYKGWTQVIKVRRKAPQNPIMIKATYVDDKLVIYPDKEFLINKDSCTVKITVPKEYAKVEIAGDAVSYVAGSNPTDLGSYSKEIQGITKGSTKSVTITITDASHNNSPFTKTLKIKHEDTSTYTPVELDRIGVGEESYKPATDVNGKNVSLTGDLLNLSVFFKKNVEAGKEKLKFTLDGGEGNKTQEIAVTGKRVNCDFASVAIGEHNVKIERLVQNEVKDTFTFKVTISPILEKITVASLKIENEKDKNNVVTFKKQPVGGARALSELQMADEANLYKYVFSDIDNISVTVDVVTEGVKLEYRVGGQGSWTEMTNNTKQDISIIDELMLVEVKITKAGFKDTLYKFKAWKKSIKMKSVTIDAQTYTWAEFEALTAPIGTEKDKIRMTATWENNEVITPRLTKNGKPITVINDTANKTATWKDVVLEPGENSFRVTFEIPGSGLKWKKKDFKINKAVSTSGNVNVADLKIFGFRRENLNPTRVEWPFARVGMNEFDIYIKPESSEVRCIKLKSPSEAILPKTTEAGYEEYYKTSQNIRSGDKIIFEVEAKDGSKKEYFVNAKGECETGNASYINFGDFIQYNNIYYGDDENVPEEKANRKKFDKDSFLVEHNVSNAKVYFKFKVTHYSGMEASTFIEGVELVKLTKKADHDIYVISYDPSSMQVGDKKDLEIHLQFKSPTNKTVDLFQHAKYTIKLTRE